MAAPAESPFCLFRVLIAPAALPLSLAGCTDDAGTPTGPEPGTSPVGLTESAAAPLVFRAVSAGDSHTCGATTDNRARCWGDNFYGELGDGTKVRRLAPAPVAAPM